MSRKLGFIFLIATLVINAQTSKKRVDMDDVFKIVNVSDPQISPDGKSIAAVVSTPNAEDDRFDSAIVLFDIASGNKRTLTAQRKGVQAPQWSPSGDRLAFTANV